MAAGDYLPYSVMEIILGTSTLMFLIPAKLLFSSEVYNYAQSLSEEGSDLYHGTKSSILQRFEITSAKSPTSSSAALMSSVHSSEKLTTLDSLKCLESGCSVKFGSFHQDFLE